MAFDVYSDEPYLYNFNMSNHPIHPLVTARDLVTSKPLQRAALIGFLLVIVSLSILVAEDMLNLRYISSRVGSPMNWEATYATFEDTFEEGMTREEVHARLLQMDPSLEGKLTQDIVCYGPKHQMRCIETIEVFSERFRIGSGFKYSFAYTSDLRLVGLTVAS